MLDACGQEINCLGSGKTLYNRREAIVTFLAGFRHAKKIILSILLILSQILQSFNIFTST